MTMITFRDLINLWMAFYTGIKSQQLYLFFFMYCSFLTSGNLFPLGKSSHFTPSHIFFWLSSQGSPCCKFARSENNWWLASHCFGGIRKTSGIKEILYYLLPSSNILQSICSNDILLTSIGIFLLHRMTNSFPKRNVLSQSNGGYSRKVSMC